MNETSTKETMASLNLPYNDISKHSSVDKHFEIESYAGAQTHSHELPKRAQIYRWQSRLPLQSTGTFIIVRTSFLFRLCKVSKGGRKAAGRQILGKLLLICTNRYFLTRTNSIRQIAGNVYQSLILMLKMWKLRQCTEPEPLLFSAEISTSFHYCHATSVKFRIQKPILRQTSNESEWKSSTSRMGGGRVEENRLQLHKHQHGLYSQAILMKLCQPHSRKNHFICKFPMSSSGFAFLSFSLSPPVL